MTALQQHWPFILFALCLWREARGCTREEKLAVAHVIANRATDPKGRWPKSIAGVVTQHAQFTSMAPPSGITPAEIQNATTWPAENDPNWVDCCEIAESFGNATEGPDPTEGATHYYSVPIPRVPTWAEPSKMTASIGHFRFFRL